MTQVLLLLSLVPVLLRPDAYWLARCIQGEVGGVLHDRETAGLWVGHTMVNRTQKPWWPDDVEEVVKDACHGYVNAPAPDPWALALALRTLSGEDLTDGALFFLSGHDLKVHSWHESRSFKYFSGPRGFSLHFFKVWPEGLE